MDKIPWKIISAFYFPIHFAVGSFYVASLVLGEQFDCRNMCMLIGNCANDDTLMLFDFFLYSGLGLILLAFVLPAMVFYRNKKIIDSKIFK